MKLNKRYRGEVSTRIGLRDWVGLWQRDGQETHVGGDINPRHRVEMVCLLRKACLCDGREKKVGLGFIGEGVRGKAGEHGPAGGIDYVATDLFYVQDLEY